MEEGEEDAIEEAILRSWMTLAREEERRSTTTALQRTVSDCMSSNVHVLLSSPPTVTFTSDPYGRDP